MSLSLVSGLFDHMVLQRNRANRSAAAMAGRTSARGPVLATVRVNGSKLKGFDRRRIGSAARGRFSAVLKNLPVGGPYEIALAVGGASLRVSDVLVGDVWLLGGQSNMQGCGFLTQPRLPVDNAVRAFYMDDRWAPAADPIHKWDPAKRRLGGASLYGALVRRLVKNGGRVAGVLWYQGCSDANPAHAPIYTKRMQRLCAALRRDCRDPRLAIAIVQIGRVIGWLDATPWNSIQAQQPRLPAVARDLLTVPVIDLSLDDNIHISGESQTVLGARLAQAMQTLRKAPQALPASIGLGKISVAQERGRTARIYTCYTEDVLARAQLHYGHGANPYCNITDEAGRSLPVFGPEPIGAPRALTSFIRKLCVSRFHPGAGRLGALPFPSAPEALAFRTRRFPTNFCELHSEIAEQRDDAAVFYACRFTCPSPERLALLLGYDGPVKAWIDGRQVAHDPDCINPATPSKCPAPFKAAAGTHEIVVALGTNCGAAWGIFLRIERLGIPLRRLASHPETVALPEVLG